MSIPPRQLHFNAFLMSPGHHEAAWRLPESNPFANTDLGHWRDLAQIAERATFDSLFLADRPAVRANPEFRPASALEPTVLLTALAAATSHIGLIATAFTTYNEPYNLARRFASLDHVSGGRAGLEHRDHGRHRVRAELRPGRPARPPGALRAGRRVRGRVGPALGQLGRRRRSGRQDGRHLRRRGPDSPGGLRGPLLPGPRAAERAPLAAGPPAAGPGRLRRRTAGSSRPATRRRSSRRSRPWPTAQEFYADMKRRARRLGRDPGQIKILPGIVPVIGSTEAEAHALSDQLEELIIPAYGLEQLARTLEVPPGLLDLDQPLPAEVFGRPQVEGAQSRCPADHRPGPPGEPHRPPADRPARRRPRAPHLHRHPGAGRGHHPGLVRPGRRRRLQRDARRAALRPPGVRRPRDPDLPPSRAVPCRIHRPDPAGALRAAPAGQPVHRDPAQRRAGTSRLTTGPAGRTGPAGPPKPPLPRRQGNGS